MRISLREATLVVGISSTVRAVVVADAAVDFASSLIYNATQLDDQQPPSDPALQCAQPSNLTVDVGYAKYVGYHNTTTGINAWKGIRYATAPTGGLRWQPPQMPPVNQSAPATPARDFGPICPQAYPAVPDVPNIAGDEDCLFLNVYAPEDANGLPVLVYIHGGGYGYGDGTTDMAGIIQANSNNFVAVTIQYRLGAFGFLASGDVKANGVANAGILDQALALLWVKTFVCQFGGDPSSVTIAGESAGGSSVMYHDLAINGGLGTLLFKQSIAASPYLPFQYSFNDTWPSDRYYAFSTSVGCPGTGSVLSCLASKDTDTLQQANFNVTQQQAYGYWAFYPVNDDAYIVGLPSQRLAAGNVNGNRLLVGHNANEGPLFVPPTITTEDDLVDWLHIEFASLSDDHINAILEQNPNSQPTDPEGLRFETDGVGPANAVNISQDANGQQQRGNNIYAEATFVCPAYWMASSFSERDLQSWHYQYSVPFASHTTDLNAYFGPATPNTPEDFVLAFQQVWGNFVSVGDPSIDDEIANGKAAADASAPNDASAWPTWSPGSPAQLNLNETGGTPYQFQTQWGVNVTQFMQPGLQNALAVVSADSWEGGRGSRCSFYETLAPVIPA